MAIRYLMASGAIEADTPGELALFLRLRETPTETAPAAIPELPLPSDEALARFWWRLNSPAQKAVIRLLLEKPQGVDAAELRGACGGAKLAGVLGAVGKNSKPDFEWGDWNRRYGDVYRLDVRFRERLAEVIRVTEELVTTPLPPPRSAPDNRTPQQHGADEEKFR